MEEICSKYEHKKQKEEPEEMTQYHPGMETWTQSPSTIGRASADHLCEPSAGEAGTEIFGFTSQPV